MGQLLNTGFGVEQVRRLSCLRFGILEGEEECRGIRDVQVKVNACSMLATFRRKGSRDLTNRGKRLLYANDWAL